ncbi:hypothetical protein MRB53_016534 [Persea americana]|uniref:Uncharacterized protein n=1 Tax=Persea americana TaxID=3435 RepID=A0ACC2M2L1_PERAE|nr:hypothetical protein MRB53_016534 [Persea americana]
MQMQWARGEEEGLPGSGVQRRKMAKERAAVAGGAAMGGRTAAARSGFHGVAATCEGDERWREMERWGLAQGKRERRCGSQR